MNQLRKWAFEQKTMVVILIVSSLCLSAVIIGQAYLFVQIVDAVFLQKLPFHAVVPMLAWLLVLLLARAGFTYLNGWTGVSMAAAVKKKVRGMLLEKWIGSSAEMAIQGQSGGKISVMMEAADGIDSYYSKYMPQMVQTSILPLVILAVVLYEHVYSGLIMMVTAPFIPLFFIIIGIKTKKKSEEQLEKLAAFSGRFLDTLQGLMTLKLFGRAARQRDLIEESSLGFREATMSILKIAFISTLMLEFISTLSIGLVALEVGLRLVVFQSIAFSTSFFVLVLAPEYYLSLKELGTAFHTGRGSLAAAEKITAELKGPEKGIKWGNLPVPERASIELQDVSFQYAEGFSLKKINMMIPAGARIAIVGATGSGKTTLLHVIAGLLDPSEGKVLIAGLPRSQFHEASWFQQVSYISQNPYLFSGTLEENIKIGAAGNPSRQEVEAAAEKAGLAALFSSLEHGGATPVGEAGRGLSGGEKQRTALARAFLKRPSIVLFDEPTTGLDLKTEQILQQSINELAQTAAVITVAHRLHTIQSADCIFFMNNGELEAAGTHTELIKKSPAYREMVKQQRGEAG